MYIEKTTAAERTMICNALDGAFADIDTAHLIIMDELEDHFMDREQKDIGTYEAERIGRRLRAAADMIFAAMLQFYLTTAQYDWRGVAPCLEGAARAQAAIRTEKAEEKCWEAKKRAGLSSKKADEINTALATYRQLPDEQAAAMLEELLKETRA